MVHIQRQCQGLAGTLSRLGRGAKLVIAVALVVLFVVSLLGGFLGYRLTHRAAGAGPEAAGIHAAAAATRSV